MNTSRAAASDPERLMLTGELTIYTVGETLAQLRAQLAEQPIRALDLSEVTELDGAGLQVLLWLCDTAQARGQPLRVVAHSAAVAEVLNLLQLNERLALTASPSGGMT